MISTSTPDALQWLKSGVCLLVQYISHLLLVLRWSQCMLHPTVHVLPAHMLKLTAPQLPAVMHAKLV